LAQPGLRCLGDLFFATAEQHRRLTGNRNEQIGFGNRQACRTARVRAVQFIHRRRALQLTYDIFIYGLAISLVLFMLAIF
jgi:hypothetical protein